MAETFVSLWWHQVVTRSVEVVSVSAHCISEESRFVPRCVTWCTLFCAIAVKPTAVMSRSRAAKFPGT